MAAISTGVGLLVGGLATAGASAYAANKNSNSGASTTAPDYAGANVAGINADAATLPFRLQINQAAQNGGVYTAPDGTVHDFRGNFDADRFFAQNPQAKKEWDEERAKGELQGWTPQQFATAFVGDNTSALTQFFTGSQAYRNQTDIDSAIQLTQAGSDISDASARRQLQTQLELLPQFNALNLKQQEDAVNKALDLMPRVGDAQRTQDTATFNNNLALGQSATRSNAALQNEVLPGVNDLSLRMQEDAFKRAQTASGTAFAGNLDQATRAAANATQQQTTNLPVLNDLSIRLQTDAYRGADAAGRSTNPNVYAVRDTFASQLADELRAGGELTAAQKNKVQQRIRGAQASRGNILGNGAAFDEAIAESDYSQNLVNDRRSAALGLINSRDLSPNFSSVGVMNPTQVVQPNLGPANFTATTAVNPLMPNFSPTGTPNLSATTAAMPSLAPANINQSNPLALLNPNAGNNAANYGLSAWQTQGNLNSQQVNPWTQGLGLVTGTALGGFSSGWGNAAFGAGQNIFKKTPATTCWVARGVLGTENDQWRRFRAWLLLDAPASFRERYIRQGERFAGWLENKPGLRAVLRPFFAARAAAVTDAQLHQVESQLTALVRPGTPAPIPTTSVQVADRRPAFRARFCRRQPSMEAILVAEAVS